MIKMICLPRSIRLIRATGYCDVEPVAWLQKSESRLRKLLYVPCAIEGVLRTEHITCLSKKEWQSVGLPGISVKCNRLKGTII